MPARTADFTDGGLSARSLAALCAPIENPHTSTLSRPRCSIERDDVACHRRVGVRRRVIGFVGVTEAAHVRHDHADSAGAQERSQARPTLDRGLGHRRREAELVAEHGRGPLQHRPGVVERSEVLSPVDAVAVQEDDCRAVTVVGVGDPGAVE